MTAQVTAGDIRAALRDRYPTDSHALLFEVGNGTGHRTNRHADALAMGLWPSRGMEVEGIEIKVSRGDWQRELAQPNKSEPIQRYCDRWWVAAPKGLIDPAELPKTWGLLELGDKGLRIKVQAPPLAHEPLDRSFIAAVLRRASKADADELDLLVARKADAMRAEIEKAAERSVKELRARVESAQAKIAEIKEATGIDLYSWLPAKEVAAAIQFGLNIAGRYNYLTHLAGSAEQLARELRAFTESNQATEQEAAPC